MTSPSVESLVQREYKYGFVTDIEADTVPQGAERGRRPAHLGQEGRAGVAARVAAQGVPPLAQDDGAALAQRHVPADRLPGHQLLLGAQDQEAARRAWTRSIPKLLETYEKLGIPLNEQKLLAGVAVDAIFDSVSVGTTYKAKLDGARHHLLLVRRGGARASRAGPEVPRLGGAGERQLLRRAQLRGVHRRLVRVHPEGRALPDGAVHLLPHQRRGDRASSSGR